MHTPVDPAAAGPRAVTHHGTARRLLRCSSAAAAEPQAELAVPTAPSSGRVSTPIEPPSPEHLARNAVLVERLRGKLILAPLTRGGNLPFRRLCADFGGEDIATMSEMGFARHLLNGDAKVGEPACGLQKHRGNSIYFFL
jgi:hypothetical protein